MIEIERKFLLKSDDWKSSVVSSHHITQGYLEDRRRIRIIDDTSAVVTIKSAPDYHPRVIERVEELEKNNSLNLDWFKASWLQHWPKNFVPPSIFYNRRESQLSIEWNVESLTAMDLNLNTKKGSIDICSGEDIIETLTLDLAGDWTEFVELARTYLPASIGQEEVEYPIDIGEARKLLEGLPTISKIRHIVPQGKHKWEIDVFEHLVMAEIELSHDTQYFERPNWLGPEVTEDKSYSNFNMLKRMKR